MKNLKMIIELMLIQTSLLANTDTKSHFLPDEMMLPS